MSRVWPGHKVSAFEQPMPHMSTLWPQIPQLFVRRGWHTDTWMVTTQAQRGEKTKDMKREIQEVHKIETEKSNNIIRLQFPTTTHGEKLQHVLAALLWWHSKWLNMCGTCKEFIAMTALLWAIGKHPKSHWRKTEISLKTRLLEKKKNHVWFPLVYRLSLE